MGLVDPELATHAKLVKAYGGARRHYHSLSHIDDCLGQLERCDRSDAQADSIALALWFHDAVYDWTSRRNEQDSADWARAFLNANKASDALISCVSDLILATRHFTPNEPTGDSALMVDIDLSILGRDTPTYVRYEQAIAFEYARVPRVFYKQGRRAVLRGFLARDRIYLTKRFNSLYEAQARRNIADAIRQL